MRVAAFPILSRALSRPRAHWIVLILICSEQLSSLILQVSSRACQAN